MFTPRTEALARAMCAALDIDPDEQFSHGYSYSPRPVLPRSGSGVEAVPAVLRYWPNWHRFAWLAQKWIYEHSGGKFTGFEETSS